MDEINLSEKLKQLEAEVENEVRIKNEATQRIWEEMTGMKDSTNRSGGSVFSVNPLTEQETIPKPMTPSASPASVQPELSHAVTLEDLNAPIITKEDFSPDEKWAMVLAGGGGKGSYQIGVWKALREMDLEKNLIALSGSSVGALNAALISLGDYDNAEKIWNSIMPEQFLDINSSTITGPLENIVQRSLINGLCSRDGLIDIIDNHLDISKLPLARIPAYVCVAWYSSDCVDCLDEKPAAEYISLSEVDRYDAKSLLLASSAMPYIYPPELIHDKIYRDGGLADNVPVLPMTCVGADKLIVVKLEPNDKVNSSLYSHFKEVVEITPSREIGDLLDGTLDFAARNVRFRMLLGYYDTLRAFSLRMYRLNGLPLNEAEKKRREDEDYEKIMSILRRERALGSAENNMSRLNTLLNKFEN